MADVEDLTDKELIKDFFILKRELENRNILPIMLINNPEMEMD
jgi:hypothetical protein